MVCEFFQALESLIKKYEMHLMHPRGEENFLWKFVPVLKAAPVEPRETLIGKKLCLKIYGLSPKANLLPIFFHKVKTLFCVLDQQ